MSARLVRWLYGAPNIVGSALALVGVVLFLVGVISGPLVPVIVAGLYAIGAIATPRPRGLSEIAVGDGLDTRQLEDALGRLVAESRERLPDELAAKVASIASTIEDILPRIEPSSIDRRDLFAVERTVSEYLPRSIDAYMTLPRRYADSHAVQDGKTPRALLAGQLDLIDEKMREIADAVAHDDVQKLLAQGRFLEDRFGKSDELSLPTVPERTAVED